MSPKYCSVVKCSVRRRQPVYHLIIHMIWHWFVCRHFTSQGSFVFSLQNRKAGNERIFSGVIKSRYYPSVFVASWSWFFVSKKDKPLHPCMDYRGINNITIKNPYPLISSTFEHLQNIKIFCTLVGSSVSLSSGYHPASIYKWKASCSASVKQSIMCVKLMKSQGKSRSKT